MKLLRIGGLATALVVAAGLGAALAPVAHGQGSAPRARTYQVFGGGSEIGVSIRDVDEADTKAAKGTPGVLVDDVAADSPAATAGIKKGDIVVEFDGERVRSVRQFTRLVSETPAGRKVSLTVSRDGQRVTLSVEPRANDAFRVVSTSLRVLGDFGRDFGYAIPPAPPAPPAPPSPPVPPTPPVPPALPDFEHVHLAHRHTLGVDRPGALAAARGVLRREGRRAGDVGGGRLRRRAKAGVKAGDVITSINGSAVESAVGAAPQRSAAEERRRVHDRGAARQEERDAEGKDGRAESPATFRSIV